MTHCHAISGAAKTKALRLRQRLAAATYKQTASSSALRKMSFSPPDLPSAWPCRAPLAPRWDALSRLFLLPLPLVPLPGWFSPSPAPSADPNGLLSSPGPGDTSHPVLRAPHCRLLAALPQLSRAPAPSGADGFSLPDFALWAISNELPRT